MFDLIKFKLILITILFYIPNVVISNKKQEINEIEILFKNGKQGFLKSYIELPDSDLFINSDVIHQTPAKFFNYSTSIQNVLNDWNENEFISNLTTCFIFANMTESISQHRSIDSKTNLARFLHQKDQYSYETSIFYQMPLFIKKLIQVPSILNCQFLKNKYLNVQMEYHLNYEDFTSFKLNEMNKLICVAKGEINFVLFRNDKENSEYLKPNINKGECIYVPEKWSFAFKTNSVWLYSISWTSINQTLDLGLCAEKETEKNINSIKFLSDITFLSEFNQSLPNVETIAYFTTYLKIRNASLNRQQFSNILKQDKFLLNSITKCDLNCENIINQLFNDLDVNFDSEFNLEDLINLDEDGAVNLNNKVRKTSERFLTLYENQIDNLKNIVKQLKDLGKGHEDLMVQMLKDKMNEWFSTLGENEKEKIKSIDLDNLIEKLFIEDKTNERRENRKKILNDIKKNNKDNANVKDSIYENDAIEADIKKEQFYTLQEEKIDEINAEDDNIDSLKTKIKPKNDEL